MAALAVVPKITRVDISIIDIMVTAARVVAMIIIIAATAKLAVRIVTIIIIVAAAAKLAAGAVATVALEVLAEMEQVLRMLQIHQPVIVVPVLAEM